MSSETKQLREFGKFRLDVAKKVLWREDRPVSLPLKEIELLCVLTENGGEVVTKNELLERVWADSFVEESNLSRHIYLLRKTFKDFGESEELIQTVPRRGYRFAAEVQEIKPGPVIIEKHTLTQTVIAEVTSQDRPLGETKTIGRLLLSLRAKAVVPAALAIAIILSGVAFLQLGQTKARNVSAIKSVAVLPFKNLVARGDAGHNGLGLSDLLITRLSNIREVNVRPTSAVMAFENQEVNSISVGRKLAVDAVLEGTIYEAADRIRVTARLLNVADGSPVWAGQFERPMQDELRMQDEIALQVVDALALSLSDNEQRALTKRYTENADAYQLYVKGRYHWNKRNYGGLSDAQRFFRSAIERDPNFALAYVGLADSLAFSADTVELSAALKKALELDPNLAEAYATRGFDLTVHSWLWREAEQAFKTSIELNPGYATAHHWYAVLLGIEGRNEEAKTELQRALEINPMSYNFLADLGQVYYFNREYDKAKEYCNRALEIYPDFTYAHEYLYDIYLLTGEYEAAIEEVAKAQRLLNTVAGPAPDLTQGEATFLAQSRASYQQGGVRQFIKSLIDGLRSGNGALNEPRSSYALALNYAFLGERDKALANLETAFEVRAFTMAWVKATPVFDTLRAEPRFRAILQKMNLPPDTH